MVDVQTTKKKTYLLREGQVANITNYQNNVLRLYANTLAIVGCKWQNMSYESQLYYKQKEVENNLVRLGRIEIPELMPIIGSEDIHYYRNKIELFRYALAYA